MNLDITAKPKDPQVVNVVFTPVINAVKVNDVKTFVTVIVKVTTIIKVDAFVQATVQAVTLGTAALSFRFPCLESPIHAKDFIGLDVIPP